MAVSSKFCGKKNMSENIFTHILLLFVKCAIKAHEEYLSRQSLTHLTDNPAVLGRLFL